MKVVVVVVAAVVDAADAAVVSSWSFVCQHLLVCSGMDDCSSCILFWVDD